jgi:hypothetical protein
MTYNYAPTNPCIVIDLPHDTAAPPIVVEPRCELTATEVIEWIKNASGDVDRECRSALNEEGMVEGMAALLQCLEDSAFPVDGARLCALDSFRELKDELQVPLNARKALIALIAHLRASSYGSRVGAV